MFFVLKESRVYLSSQQNTAHHPENIRAQRFRFEKQEICTNRMTCFASHGDTVIHCLSVRLIVSLFVTPRSCILSYLTLAK